MQVNDLIEYAFDRGSAILHAQTQPRPPSLFPTDSSACLAQNAEADRRQSLAAIASAERRQSLKQTLNLPHLAQTSQFQTRHDTSSSPSSSVSQSQYASSTSVGLRSPPVTSFDHVASEEDEAIRLRIRQLTSQRQPHLTPQYIHTQSSRRQIHKRHRHAHVSAGQHENDSDRSHHTAVNSTLSLSHRYDELTFHSSDDEFISSNEELSDTATDDRVQAELDRLNDSMSSGSRQYRRHRSQLTRQRLLAIQRYESDQLKADTRRRRDEVEAAREQSASNAARAREMNEAQRVQAAEDERTAADRAEADEIEEREALKKLDWRALHVHTPLLPFERRLIKYAIDKQQEIMQQQAAEGSIQSGASSPTVDSAVPVKVPLRYQPFHLQSDPNMLSPQSIAARSVLRNHPKLVRVMTQFWSTFTQVDQKHGLVHSDYLSVHVKMQKAMFRFDNQHNAKMEALYTPNITTVIGQIWPSSVGDASSPALSPASPPNELSNSSGTTSKPSLSRMQTRATSRLSMRAPSRARHKSSLPAPVFDEAAALRLAERDWKRDVHRSSGNANGLKKEAFLDSLFELVDMWTETTDVKEYVEVLQVLFHRITQKKNESNAKWRNTRAVKFESIDRLLERQVFDAQMALMDQMANQSPSNVIDPMQMQWYQDWTTEQQLLEMQLNVLSDGLESDSDSVDEVTQPVDSVVSSKAPSRSRSAKPKDSSARRLARFRAATMRAATMAFTGSNRMQTLNLRKGASGHASPQKPGHKRSRTMHASSVSEATTDRRMQSASARKGNRTSAVSRSGREESTHASPATEHKRASVFWNSSVIDSQQRKSVDRMSVHDESQSGSDSDSDTQSTSSSSASGFESNDGQQFLFRLLANEQALRQFVFTHNATASISSHIQMTTLQQRTAAMQATDEQAEEQAKKHLEDLTHRFVAQVRQRDKELAAAVRQRPQTHKYALEEADVPADPVRPIHSSHQTHRDLPKGLVPVLLKSIQTNIPLLDQPRFLAKIIESMTRTQLTSVLEEAATLAGEPAAESGSGGGGGGIQFNDLPSDSVHGSLHDSLQQSGSSSPNAPLLASALTNALKNSHISEREAVEMHSLFDKVDTFITAMNTSTNTPAFATPPRMSRLPTMKPHSQQQSQQQSQQPSMHTSPKHAFKSLACMHNSQRTFIAAPMDDEFTATAHSIEHANDQSPHRSTDQATQRSTDPSIDQSESTETFVPSESAIEAAIKLVQLDMEAVDPSIESSKFEKIMSHPSIASFAATQGNVDSLRSMQAQLAFEQQSLKPLCEKLIDDLALLQIQQQLEMADDEAEDLMQDEQQTRRNRLEASRKVDGRKLTWRGAPVDLTTDYINKAYEKARARNRVALQYTQVSAQAYEATMASAPHLAQQWTKVQTQQETDAFIRRQQIKQRVDMQRDSKAAYRHKRQLSQAKWKDWGTLRQLKKFEQQAMISLHKSNQQASKAHSMRLDAALKAFHRVVEQQSTSPILSARARDQWHQVHKDGRLSRERERYKLKQQLMTHSLPRSNDHHEMVLSDEEADLIQQFRSLRSNQQQQQQPQQLQINPHLQGWQDDRSPSSVKSSRMPFHLPEIAMLRRDKAYLSSHAQQAAREAHMSLLHLSFDAPEPMDSHRSQRGRRLHSKSPERRNHVDTDQFASALNESKEDVHEAIERLKHTQLEHQKRTEAQRRHNSSIRIFERPDVARTVTHPVAAHLASLRSQSQARRHMPIDAAGRASVRLPRERDLKSLGPKAPAPSTLFGALQQEKAAAMMGAHLPAPQSRLAILARDHYASRLFEQHPVDPAPKSRRRVRSPMMIHLAPLLSDAHPVTDPTFSYKSDLHVILDSRRASVFNEDEYLPAAYRQSMHPEVSQDESATSQTQSQSESTADLHMTATQHLQQVNAHKDQQIDDEQAIRIRHTNHHTMPQMHKIDQQALEAYVIEDERPDMFVDILQRK